MAIKDIFGKISGDKGRRRGLVLIALVFAAIGAGLYLRAKPDEARVTQLRPVPNQQPTVQGGNVVSPTYQQALNEADRQRATEAQAKGESTVPTIVLTPQSKGAPEDPDRQRARLPGNEPPRQDAVVPPQPLRIAQPLPPPTPAARPVNDQVIQNVARSFGPMNDEKLVGAKVDYFNDGKLSGAGSDGMRQLAQIVAANQGSVADSLKPFPGTVLYATMVSEANSDAPGPVLARIEQGPLSGATLIGQFKIAQNALVIDFKKMTVVSVRDGRQVARTVEVEAFAVDTDKLGTALATDVDRHLFQKVAITAAASFVQGLGNAVGQSGATVTRDMTGTTIGYPQLDTRQQLLVAGGQTAGQVGSILSREFGNVPTTVKVRSGTPIGILFL